VRQDSLEGIHRGAQGHAVDEEVGLDLVELVQAQEPVHLHEILHLEGIGVVHPDLVVPAELLGEPGSHLSRAEYENLHG